MAMPQAVSLAVGSLLVVLISYRLIFLVMAVVTTVAAAYVVVALHGQIAADRRRTHDADHTDADPDQSAETAADETAPPVDLLPPLTPTEL
jgi:hypothetical protein